MKHIFDEIIYKMLSFFCWSYLWIVYMTSRVSFIYQENSLSIKQSGKPFIFALWHHQQFFLCFMERNQEIRTLVSNSKDGEYVTRFLKVLGFDPIRGSSSKGGARAYAEMIRSVKKGKVVAVTPDGPRGPKGEIQSGIIQVAMKAKCPVIPLSYHAKRKKVFNSWDRFEIPYPFNNIRIMYGRPMHIKPSDSKEDAKEKLKDALNENILSGDNEAVAN